MLRNISNPLQYLFYKMGGAKGAFTFKASNGIVLLVPKRLVTTFKEMFFRVPYAEGLPGDLKMKSEPLVIDIGANVGFFSFWVLSKYPKATIHAFEPFPPNLALFQRYKEKHLPFNLNIHPSAIAGKPGSFKLHYNADDDFSTSAALSDNQEGSEVEVQAITLPDFLEQEKIVEIDWLKVDCEGAEYGIFQNLPAEVLARTRIVTLENHHSDNPGETQADLVKLLQGHGFRVKTNGYSPLIWAWRE
jgi:FkbM family methyltransferase